MYKIQGKGDFDQRLEFAAPKPWTKYTKKITKFMERLYIHISARACTEDPPLAWMGIEMDWPLKKRILGSVVSYTCPFKTKTNLEELTGILNLFFCLFLFFCGI